MDRPVRSQPDGACETSFRGEGHQTAGGPGSESQLRGGPKEKGVAVTVERVGPMGRGRQGNTARGEGMRLIAVDSGGAGRLSQSRPIPGPA